MKKTSFVKRRASHAAATPKQKPSSGKSEREEAEEQSVRNEIAAKEDLNLHPEKRRELGEQEKEKFDQVEKEVTEVFQKHGIDMDSAFVVQLRSLLFQARNANVPPEMREGPGVASMPLEQREALKENVKNGKPSKK